MSLPRGSSTSSPGLYNPHKISALYQNGLQSPQPSFRSRANRPPSRSTRISRIVPSKLTKSRSRRAFEMFMQKRAVQKFLRAMPTQPKSLGFLDNSANGTVPALSHQPTVESSSIASVGPSIITTHPTNKGQNRRTYLIVNNAPEAAGAPTPSSESPAPNTTRFAHPAVNHIISPALQSSSTAPSEWGLEHGDTPLTADFPNQVNPTRIASARISHILNIAESHNRLDGVGSQNAARVDVRMSHAGPKQSIPLPNPSSGPPQMPLVAKIAPLSPTGLEESGQYYANQNDRRRTKHLASVAEALASLEGGPTGRLERIGSEGSVPNYLAPVAREVKQQAINAAPARGKGKHAADPRIQHNIDAVHQATNPADAVPALVNDPQTGTDDLSYRPYSSGYGNLIPNAQDEIQLGGRRKSQSLRQSYIHRAHYQREEQLIQSRPNTPSSEYSQSTHHQSAAVLPSRPMPQSTGSLQRKPLPKRPTSASSDAIVAARAASGLRPDSTFSAYKNPRPAPSPPPRRHAQHENPHGSSVIGDNDYSAYDQPVLDAHSLGQMSPAPPSPDADRTTPPPQAPVPQNCYTDGQYTHHVLGCRCSKAHTPSHFGKSKSEEPWWRPDKWSPERKQKSIDNFVSVITKEKYRKRLSQVARENDIRAEAKKLRRAVKAEQKAKIAREEHEAERARNAAAWDRQ